MTLSDDIVRKAEEDKAELLKVVNADAATLVRAYEQALEKLNAQIAKFVEEVAAEMLEGGNLEAIYQKAGRLRSLEDQLIAALASFGVVVEKRVNKTLESAIVLSSAAQVELLDMYDVSLTFNQLPDKAAENLQDQLKISRTMISGVASDLWDTLQETLTANLLIGKHPRDTAKELSDKLGMPLKRALTISRTETIRAYRETSHKHRLAYPTAIDSWIWIAALKPNTCVICWSKHGSVHKLEERLNDHPNGACTSIPQVKGFELDVPTGESAFEVLSDDEKRKILGPERFDLYQDKGLSLSSLISSHDNETWGTQYKVRSVSEVRKSA